MKERARPRGGLSELGPGVCLQAHTRTLGGNGVLSRSSWVTEATFKMFVKLEQGN